MACALARAGHPRGRHDGPQQRVQRDRDLLQQDGHGDFWRRLCGASLCRSAGSRYLWLAASGRNARRARHGGDDSGAIDHGSAVRGVHGRLPRSGHASPMLAGTLGGLLTTWVTFTPCFLWIFLGAPFIETLRGNKALNAALSGITAAVVGVILNLAV